MLHLLYEDLKLDKLRFPVEGRKIRRLLLACILHGAADFSLPKSAFIAHYLSDAEQGDDLQLRLIFAKELKKHGDLLRDGVDKEIEQVPKIMEWLD